MTERDAATVPTFLNPYPRRSAASRHRTQRSLRSFQETLRRADASLVALSVLVAALLAVAWQSGGYFPAGYLRTGAVAAFGVAALLIFRVPAGRISREAQLALFALAALTVWTWVARTWSPSPASGLADAQRDLVYVGIFALAVLAAGSGRTAGAAVWIVLGAMLTIVLAGLTNRLFPNAPANPSDYRLSYPLDYWNAYGAMAAMAAVLAMGITADRRVPAVLRSISAAVTLPTLVAMYLSLSRGAWLALGCGLIALVLVAPRRLTLLASLALLGSGFVIALLRLHTLPALVDNPHLGAGQSAAGRHFTPWLLGLALACGLGQFGIALSERWLAGRFDLPSRRKLLPRPPTTVVLVTLAVIAICAGFALEPRLVRAWNASGQASQALNGSSRLTTLQTSRHDAYRVAIKEWKSAPLVGVGSGGYEVGWYEDRHVNESIVNAHSLYLETMAELGLIGLAILLSFIAAVLTASARSRRRPVGLGRTRTAGVTAAVVVWLVHAGIDWDWQMTSLTGLALILMAMLMVPRLDPSRGAARPLWRQSRTGAVGFGGCAVAFVIIAVYLLGAGSQARRLDTANRLGAQGHFAQSLAMADTVTEAPSAAGARLTEAYDLQDMGNLAAADEAFRLAAAASPSDWALRANWADELLQLHDETAARIELRRAEQLNPFLKSQLTVPLSRLTDLADEPGEPQDGLR